MSTDFKDLSVEVLLTLSHATYAGITAEHIASLSKDKMHAIHINWLSPSALAGLTADNITGIKDHKYFNEWCSPSQMASISPKAFAALDEGQLLAISETNYAGITAEHIASLSKDKMHAIHINWLSSSALAGLTPDNITGIKDPLYFREWISPAQMALINPAAIAALTYEQYLAIKLASMNALTDAQLNARNTAKGWFAVKTEVDRFKELLGGVWENVEPLNDPDFVTWFKRLPLGVIDAIITDTNGNPGFGLNFSCQKLLSTNQISDSTGFSNGSLSKNSLSAIFKTIASGSTQADISQFNVETIAGLIYAMDIVQGDWVGIGDDGRWVWRLTEAQVSAVSKQYPAHGAILYRLWIGPEGYEDYYLNNDIFVKQFQALSSLSIDELLSGFQFGQTPIGLKLPYQKLLTVAQIKNLSAKTLETLRANPLPTHDKLGDAAPVLLWAHGKKNPQLTNALLQLTSADAQLLNANHMAILSELDLVYHIPASAIPGLTAEAVAGLSAAQFNGSFTDLEVPLLKLTKVKSETFAAVNAKFISMLSTSQFASLTTDQLKALSDEAVSGVTVEQVNARYLAYFNGRILQKDYRYIIENLDELVGKLRDTLIFKMVARYLNTLFPGDSRFTGTALAIPELSVKDVVAADPYQLKEWASNLTNDLRLIDSLKRFTSEDATKLRNNQVQALNGFMQYLPVQALSGLTSTVVGALSTAQLSEFSNEQLQQLNVSQLTGSTLIQLGGNFANRLTASQVQSLSEPTVTQLLGNSNGVIANLSPRFFQALSDTVLVNAIVSNPIHIQRILGQLSPAQIAALRPSAINGLITSHLFTARMMLDIGQTAVWTFDQFHAMTAIPGALALIDPNALANALSVDALLSLSPTEISQLTAQQYEALLNNLTLSKVIFNAGMGEGYWTVAQLQALAPNTVAYMTQDQYLSYANPLGLALFTSDQQAGMSTNVGLLEILVTGQVNFWDQVTMARIISTIPGMIPLSGLPGGGSGTSKATNVHTIYRQDCSHMNVSQLRVLFSEGLHSFGSLDTASLERNPNLPEALRLLTAQNITTLFNDHSDLISGFMSELLQANESFVTAVPNFNQNGLLAFLDKQKPPNNMHWSIARALVDSPVFRQSLISLNAYRLLRILDDANLVRFFDIHSAREVVQNPSFNEVSPNIGLEALSSLINNGDFMRELNTDNYKEIINSKNFELVIRERLNPVGMYNLLRSDIILQIDAALGYLLEYPFFGDVLLGLNPEEWVRISSSSIARNEMAAPHFLKSINFFGAIKLLDASGLRNILQARLLTNDADIAREIALNAHYQEALIGLDQESLANVFNSRDLFDAVTDITSLTQNTRLFLAAQDLTSIGVMNLMNNIDSASSIFLGRVVDVLVKNKNFVGAVGGFNRQAIRFVLLNPDLLNRVVLIDLVQNRYFADVINDMDGRQIANFINNTGLIEQAEGATAIIANERGFLAALPLLSALGLERVFNNRISNDGVKRIGARAVTRILRNPNFGGLFARLSIENQDWAIEGLAHEVPFATFVSENIQWITVPMLERIEANHPNTFLRLDPASFTLEVMQNLLMSPAGRFLLNHVSIDVASKIGGADTFTFYDSLSRDSFARLLNGAAQFLNRISPAIVSKLLRVNTLQDLTTAGLIQILTTTDAPGAFINRLAGQHIEVIFGRIPPATLAGLNAGQADLLVDEFWYLVTSQQLSAMMTSPTLGATYFDQPGAVGHIRVASLQQIEGSVLAATYQAALANVPIIRNAWNYLTEAQQTALKALPHFIPPPNGDLLVFEDNPTLSNKRITLVGGVIDTPENNASDVQLDLLTQKMAVFNASSSSTGAFTQAAQAGSELMKPPLRFASSAVQ